MTRIATGEYKIEFHDHYGAKIRLPQPDVDAFQKACSFTDAQEKGKDGLDCIETARSFVISRVVYNSLDPNAQFNS